MKIRDNKIVEATEDELFSVYLENGLDEFLSFPIYMERCKEFGTKIIEDSDEE